MSDCPMLISNKLHSFRNFSEQRYDKYDCNQIANFTKQYLRTLRNLGT